MGKSFDGKTVLVTGASSGIGRATAIAFAREGAKVVVAARRVKESGETVRQIEAVGGDAYFVRTDVSQSPDVQALVARTIERYGALNIAVNNAGIDPEAFMPIAKYDEAIWDRVIDTNLKGVFLCMKYELPHIVESKGAIVNMASVAGLTGGPMASSYFASKHGVVGLTKAAAMEYAPSDEASSGLSGVRSGVGSRVRSEVVMGGSASACRPSAASAPSSASATRTAAPAGSKAAEPSPHSSTKAARGREGSALATIWPA